MARPLTDQRRPIGGIDRVCPRAIVCIVQLAALLWVCHPNVATADEPRKFVTVTRERNPPLVLETHASVWFTEFQRPERACGLTSAGTVRGGGSCPSSSSQEMTATFGASVRAHISGPLYLGWGMGIGYSEPEFELLSTQTIILMPFTVTVTWPELPLIPILEGALTGYVLLPDGLKSAMVSARAGLGFPVENITFGFTGGYGYADTFEPVELRVFLSVAP